MENSRATELHHEIAGLQLGLDRLIKLEEEYREMRDDSDRYGFEYFENKRSGIADIIFLYFSPGTKSPISLLELGIHSQDRPNKLVVCCPDGFWRKGNVEIVCSRNGIPLFNDLDSAIASLKTKIYVQTRDQY